MCVCSDDHSRAHQRSAAINKAVDCGSKMLPHLPFFMDLAPSGSNLLPNVRKTFDSYVFADNEEMIGSVMDMQGMLEIFFFKACLRARVKSCDKFGNMNDDYIDQQTFFVFKSSSYLCSFMVGAANFLNTPRTRPGDNVLKRGLYHLQLRVDHRQWHVYKISVWVTQR